jgi:hypothetical protein
VLPPERDEASERIATVSIWKLSGPATGLVMVVALLFYRVVGGIPVNELAMNFASQRIDDGYLKVLIVAQALVAKMLREHMAVLDRFNVGVELNSNPVAQRNAVFHIEEKCLHCHYLARLYRSLASSADRRAEATIGNGLPRLRALF